jgi:hypothetical protein
MADINLKTLTPDTSLPKTGFLFGADSQASTDPSVYSTQTVATTLLGSTSLTGDVLTTSAPVLNLTQEWSNGSVAFTGIKYNTTNTNSAAASLLMDLQVGGISLFSVVKDGSIRSAVLDGPVISFAAASWRVANFGWVSGSRAAFLAPGTGTFGGGVGIGTVGNTGFFTPDVLMTRGGPANLRFGNADAASPVAQTLSVQSVVAGTPSTAGADFTLTGSQNTGSGLAGNLIVSTGFSNTVGTATVTITIATPGVITWTAHGLVTGSPVVFTTTGALPTGITAGTTYFAITSSTLGVNTFQIATSAANAAAGTAVATSGTQSGVQTGTTSATVQSPLMTTTTFGPSGLTGSQTTPVLNLAQTWNTSGNATGIKLNVTNTASGSSSLLMDLQVGGTSKFKVDKNGDISFGNNLTASTFFNFNIGSIIYLSLSSQNDVQIPNGFKLGFSASTNAPDLFIGRRGAANLRFGAADASVPVAQTLSVQSIVAGQTNASAAAYPFTITGAQGTGSGAGGSIIFQTAAANAGGGATVQNTLTDTLTLDSVGSVRVVRALTVATLPGTPLAGMIARVSDASAPVIGTTVAGSGAAYALVNYNGSNWTVIGV